MGVFAVSILAATRLTSSVYPTSNFIGQMITARCDNTKEALRAKLDWCRFCMGFRFTLCFHRSNDLLKQFALSYPQLRSYAPQHF